MIRYSDAMLQDAPSFEDYIALRASSENVLMVCKKIEKDMEVMPEGQDVIKLRACANGMRSVAIKALSATDQISLERN